MSWRVHTQLRMFKLETPQNKQLKQGCGQDIPRDCEFAHPS